MKSLLVTSVILLSSCQPASQVATATQASHPVPKPECSASDIRISKTNAGMVDPCRSRSCPSLKGVTTIFNGCPYPVGVQIQVVLEDAAGNALAVKDFWPASTRNLPQGESVVSLDYPIDLSNPKAASSFAVKAVAVRRW